jgi:prepilin signal peptidase PulO-like enzyme (type II secretory pathway)
MNAVQLSSMQILFLLLFSFFSGKIINLFTHFFLKKKPKLYWLNWLIQGLAVLVLGGHCLLTFGDDPAFCFTYILPLFSLLLAIQTDVEAMIILSPFSLWLAPLGVFFASQEWLSVSTEESLLGILFGYGSLWLINKMVQFFRAQNGVGEGDMELMALVGAFWGAHAACYILWGAATLGVIGGLLLSRKNIKMKVF